MRSFKRIAEKQREMRIRNGALRPRQTPRIKMGELRFLSWPCAESIRDTRLFNGWSQAHLADVAECHRSVIIAIDRFVKFPHVYAFSPDGLHGGFRIRNGTLDRILKALGMDAKWAE